jgi:hypothetical protein
MFTVIAFSRYCSLISVSLKLKKQKHSYSCLRLKLYTIIKQIPAPLGTRENYLGAKPMMQLLEKFNSDAKPSLPIILKT